MKKLLTAALAAVALMPLTAAAQDSATLTVIVKDNYGVLPGAIVRVSRDGSNDAFRASAERDGKARFTALAEGSYTVRVSLPGFADETKTIRVARSGDALVDVTLSLAQFSTTVTVTTANRREELLMNAADPTTVIDQSEMKDTGARNAKDLLYEQGGSGVQVTPGGGQGHVSLNGIPNSGVLVMVDGRRYLGRDANGNFNLEDLPLTGIDRIEVVKGAGSAIYGSDAMGGVINFITKKPKERGFTDSMNLTSGTYADYRADNALTFRGDKGGFGVAGGYRTYDGFDLEPIPSKPNPQTIGQPESKWKTVSSNGDYRFSDKVTGRFGADYWKRDIDKYFFSGATQLSNTVYNSQRALERYTVTPEFEFSPGSHTTINVSYNYSRYNRDETQLYIDRPSNPVVVVPRWTESNDEIKGRILQTFRLNGRVNPFQAGFERRDESLSRSGLVGCLTGQACLKERNLNVVWAQQELSLTSDLKVTAGFRYDDSSDYGSQTSPKASLVYSLPKNNHVRVSYGKGFRAPYFGELYLVTFGFQGNADLKPERSETWTGGWSLVNSRVEASVDLFKARINDGIAFFQLSPVLFTYNNVSSYDSKGVNAALSLSLPYGFTPSVSYTYNKRADDLKNEIGGYPRNSAFVKLLWSNPRLGLRANIRGQINGQVPTALGATSFQPKYDIWNAQVSKRVQTKGRYAFNVFAQVNNAFDKTNIFNVDKDGNPRINETLPVWLPGRTYLAGITIDADWAK